MSTTGQRIRDFGEGKFGKRGMSKLAEALHISPQALTTYLNNSRIPGHVFQQKLRELGADVEYIMTGKKKEEEQNFVIPAGHFFRVVMSIDAGDPVLIFKEENMTGEKVFFPFGSPETCFALKVVGNSMTCEGARSIQEGALALADLSENPLPGDVVAVSLTGGRQMIKQYMEGPEKEYVTLHSFNPDYPDIVVKKQEVHKMVRIIGISNFKRL